MITVFELPDLAFPIKVEQSEGKGRLFRVTYGEEVKSNLTYEQACREFGCSVFHALACDGRIVDE